jgi:hypothetical protein
MIEMFNKIVESLPNGFHDAFLNNLNIDWINKSLNLELEIWMDEGPIKGKYENNENWAPRRSTICKQSNSHINNSIDSILKLAHGLTWEQTLRTWKFQKILS